MPGEVDVDSRWRVDLLLCLDEIWEVSGAMEQTAFDEDHLPIPGVAFTDASDEEDEEALDHERYRDAVVWATDWTIETVVNQLKRGNINLSPAFQRRDAWKRGQKSRFIESLILGLPIPQIVLAEAKGQRGQFIVLDGKQRLLSILQFWGEAKGGSNEFQLSGLKVRSDLNRKRFKDLQTPSFRDELDQLSNMTLRTVVIRNWPSVDYLHVVFLRLNTGSAKLSPQELRQALFPGPFTTWIDEEAARSVGIRQLLKLDGPDYRMRDIEVLARFLAFRSFLTTYKGRMSAILDHVFEYYNRNWDSVQEELQGALNDFEAAIKALVDVFGAQTVGRRPGSSQVNRAILDFLMFYAQSERIRTAMLGSANAIREAYKEAFEDQAFRLAVERDTAGAPNTVDRLAGWGRKLGRTIGMELPLPVLLPENDAGSPRIEFRGFGFA